MGPSYTTAGEQRVFCASPEANIKKEADEVIIVIIIIITIATAAATVAATAAAAAAAACSFEFGEE